jgi:hypothetical protein
MSVRSVPYSQEIEEIESHTQKEHRDRQVVAASHRIGLRGHLVLPMPSKHSWIQSMFARFWDGSPFESGAQDPMIGQIFLLIESFETMEASEDEDDHLVAKLRNEVGNRIEGCMKQALAVARVPTPFEFMKKSQHIQKMMRIAEAAFIQTPELCDLYVQADKLAATSAFGTLSEEHRAIIELYWNHISTKPDGQAIHAKYEQQQSEILTRIFSDMTTGQLDIGRRSHNIIEQAQQFVQCLADSVRREEAALHKKWAECATSDEKICLDYLILQSRVIGQPLIKDLQKTTLEPMAQTLERQIRFGSDLLEWEISSSRRLLEMHHQSAEVYRKYLEHLARSAKEKGDHLKNPSGTHEECCPANNTEGQDTAIIENLISQTRGNLEQLEEKIRQSHQHLQELESMRKQPEAYGRKLYGDPSKISRLIPEMTEHDKAVVRAFGIRQQLEGLHARSEISLPNAALFQQDIAHITLDRCIAELRRSIEERLQWFQRVVNRYL